MTRLCTHCIQPIPDAKRRGTRFCKAACRVNHHIAAKSTVPLTAGELREAEITPEAAGLLIDSAVPWYPYLPPMRTFYIDLPDSTPRKEYWRQRDQEQRFRRAAAKRLQRATRRLVALGLVRIGKPLDRNRIVIERTELGSKLLRRRNDLPASAVHAGWPVKADKREWIDWE